MTQFQRIGQLGPLGVLATHYVEQELEIGRVIAKNYPQWKEIAAETTQNSRHVTHRDAVSEDM